MNSEQGNKNMADGPDEWWRGLFTSRGWVDVHAGIPRERSAADVDIMLRLLGLPAGTAILDIPCGEGRHSIDLASRGYRVTGLDQSAPLLEIARAEGAQRGVNVEWVEGDMRRLSWRGEFDGVVCYWGSFGYFDDEGNFEFLQGSAQALRAGGRMIIETQVLETLLPKFQSRGWIKINDVYMLEDRKYDHTTGRAETDWIFIRDGEVAEWHSSIRMYTYAELVEILRDAGFSRAHGLDTQTGAPFTLGSPRLCMVATR